ncbi:hypothetical protein [Methylomicrobium agile]|uniref:hypothetical protein n=1 Tax=Methylomicrobium agile TaxID=39774 RepID=UPI0012F658AC|nr:hypothetical protein [Methylomicrobium agile]
MHSFIKVTCGLSAKGCYAVKAVYINPPAPFFKGGKAVLSHAIVVDVANAPALPFQKRGSCMVKGARAGVDSTMAQPTSSFDKESGHAGDIPPLKKGARGICSAISGWGNADAALSSHSI